MISGLKTPDGALYIIESAPAAGDPANGGVSMNNDGWVRVDGLLPPQVFANGFGFRNNGALCINKFGTAIAGYQQGLPFNSVGQLVCQLNQPVSPGDAFVGGLRVGPLGGVYVVDAAPVWTPANLFASGEQGAWYDPSDPSTMFQDRAGTTPVTADGQTVGLILDKSKGGYGANMIAAPDAYPMTPSGTNPPTFTLVSSFLGETCTKTDFNQSGAVSYPDSRVIGADTSATTTANTLQKCVVRVALSRALVGTEKVQIYEQDGQGPLLADLTSATPSGQWIYSSATGFRTTTSASNLAMFTYGTFTGGPLTVYLRQVSLTDWVGNHAVAPSDAARPLYKTDGTYHWLQFDGVDDSLSTAAIDKSGWTGGSLFTGHISTAGQGTTFDGLEASGALTSHEPFSDNNWYVVFGNSNRINASTLAFGTKYVLTRLHESNSSLYRKNGSSAGSAAAGTTDFGGSSVVYIGSSGAANYLNGKVFSFVLVNRKSTAQEITDTETWIAAKTGVTL